LSTTRKYTITTAAGSLAFTILWEHEQTTLDPEDFGFQWSDSDTAGSLTSPFDVEAQPFNEPILACAGGLYDLAAANLKLPSGAQAATAEQWAGVSIGDDHYGCNGAHTFIFRAMRPRKLPGNDLFDYWTGPSSAAGDFNLYDGDATADDANYLTLGPDARKYRVPLASVATAIALANKLVLRAAREAMTPEYTGRVNVYYEVPSLGYYQLLHTIQWSDLLAVGTGFTTLTCDNATLGDAGRFTGPWAVVNDLAHYMVLEYVPDMENVTKQPEIYFAGLTGGTGAPGKCYPLDVDGAWSADNYKYAGPTDFYLYALFCVAGVDYGVGGSPTFEDVCLVRFCARNRDGYESFPSPSRRAALPVSAAGYCKLYPLAADLLDADVNDVTIYRTLAGELAEGSTTTSPSVFYRWGTIPAKFLDEDGAITLYLAGDDTWLADQEEIKLTSRDAQQPYQACAEWKSRLWIADRNRVYYSAPYEPENINLATEQPLDEDIMLLLPLGDRMVACGPSRQWLFMEYGDGFAVEEINKSGIGAASRSYCRILTPQGMFGIIQGNTGHIYAINGIIAQNFSELTMENNLAQILPANLKLTRIFFNAENEREVIVSICQGAGAAPTVNLVFDLDLWAFTHVESMPAAAWALNRCYSTVEENKIIGALGGSVFHHYSAAADLGSDIPFELITRDDDNGAPKLKKQLVSDTADVYGQDGQQLTVEWFRNGHAAAVKSKTYTLAGGNEEIIAENIGRAKSWRRRYSASDQLGELAVAAITPELSLLGSERQ